MCVLVSQRLCVYYQAIIMPSLLHCASFWYILSETRDVPHLANFQASGCPRDQGVTGFGYHSTVKQYRRESKHHLNQTKPNILILLWRQDYVKYACSWYKIYIETTLNRQAKLCHFRSFFQNSFFPLKTEAHTIFWTLWRPLYFINILE